MAADGRTADPRHARRSSLQLMPSTSAHNRQASSGGSRAVSRLSHPRTASSRQPNSITAILAGGASNERQRAGRVLMQPSATQHEIDRRQRTANSTQRHQGKLRNTAAEGEAVCQQDDVDEQSSEDEDAAQQWLAREGESPGSVDESAPSSDRPLTLHASLTSVDVSSVARQAPAPWWSGARLPAVPLIAIQPALQQLSSADFNLGQSDALLPFAPSSSQHAALPHHAAFAHLALNHRQADFTADQTYVEAAAAQVPHLSDRPVHNSQVAYLLSTIGRGWLERRVAAQWQIMRLVEPHGGSELSPPLLSATCLTAIRPWPALCSQAAVR